MLDTIDYMAEWRMFYILVEKKAKDCESRVTQNPSEKIKQKEEYSVKTPSTNTAHKYKHIHSNSSVLFLISLPIILFTSSTHKIG